MAKFVISRQKVLEQYDKVSEIADYVSYSSKTNPVVTGILEENTDSMFSIHLKNELKNVKDKSRVMFLAQAWKKNDVAELVSLGVEWFVVDNELDLAVFEDFLSTFSGKLNLLLRIKLKENTLRTEKYFVFGMSSEVVSKKLELLRNNDKIGKLGIHFHRKTQNMAEWNYQQEFTHGHIIDLNVLEKLDVVCIGGGLPSEYANTNVDVIASVLDKIKSLGKWLTEKNVKMMVEPGRFIAAPAGKLISRIESVYENTIVLDVSVYNTDMDALIVPVKLRVAGELEKGEAYVIKGITPCSMDLFRYRVYLDPANVDEGKELVFLNAGAYNFATAFCDLSPVLTEIVA